MTQFYRLFLQFKQQVGKTRGIDCYTWSQEIVYNNILNIIYNTIFFTYILHKHT